MLKIFNTLTKQKEDFKPIFDNTVSFYQCGPTVYWTQHIGNMRAVVMSDLIRRSLIYLGYEVTFVRNYTDVGHLVSDEDEGEDKMEKGAKREGLSPKEIADKYIQIFEDDIAALNILSADSKPKATEYIEEMISMIEVLLEKGFAYTTPKAVYFDVSKAKDYNKLNKQKLELNRAGAGRGTVGDSNKRHEQDFALWFFRTGAHKNAIQYWSSPFISSEVNNGEGFPGWHIECSAMAKKLLGETIDIHMGGIEHISVHHTNEIAQSESANGKEFVHYWLHNEHLNVNDRKMAKSEGTGYSLAEIKEKGFDPMDLRYFFLNSHYRSKQNFTWEALEGARNAYINLREKIKLDVSYAHTDGEKEVSKEYKQKFIEALEDDFNIPKALALLFEVLKTSKLTSADIYATVMDMDRVLGLNLAKIHSEEGFNDKQLEQINRLIKHRNEARKVKDWVKSDEIRDKLMNEYGIEIEDTNDGTKWIKRNGNI